MSTTMNSTRGVSHDPAEARKARELAQSETAREHERQVRVCYQEHMPGQRRWLGAQRAGVLS